MRKVFVVDLRHRQPVAPERARELEERDILFPHSIQNPNRRRLLVSQSNNIAPRATELALQRHHTRGRRTKVFLEKFLEHVHKDSYGRSSREAGRRVPHCKMSLACIERLSMALPSTIDFPPVPDLQHHHDQLLVFQLTNGAVVADAVSPQATLVAG